MSFMSFTESFTGSFSVRLRDQRRTRPGLGKRGFGFANRDARRREHEHGDALDDGGVFGFVTRVVVRVARVARRALTSRGGAVDMRSVVSESPDPRRGQRAPPRVGRDCDCPRRSRSRRPPTRGARAPAEDGAHAMGAGASGERRVQCEHRRARRARGPDARTSTDPMRAVGLGVAGYCADG